MSTARTTPHGGWGASTEAPWSCRGAVTVPGMRAHLPAAAVAGFLAGCLVLLASATSAVAVPVSASGGTIGGPLLASAGVVENPRHGAPPLPAPASLPASSWLVANLTTGQVLAAKDPHGKFLPASTLKVLTADTLLPRLHPTAMVRATYRDATVDGSRVGLVPGMRYSVSKLFTCMLVVSANDAADALAQANGGIRHTVKEMNTEAHQLQADDTFAMTPSGLDGVGETTSAYDLALIAKHALAIPAFRHYVSIVRSTVPAPHHKHFAIYTHNELLTTYRGDIGVKNGYTVAAMGTYIGAATRGGQTILITLMHAYPNFWPMAKALLNWGFKATGKVTPVGTLVAPLAPTRPKQAAYVAHPEAAARVSARAAGRLSHSWRPALEVVAALLVVVGVALLVRWRARRRRSRYRTRLKLPPI
jgi:serine-type D-Ala-D-Ala carboxypeptidase (penicillin-binding protein 5/6)